MAVQLDDVQLIVLDMLADILEGGIHKHAHLLNLRWQILRPLSDIALGLGPEDKPHQVYPQCLYLADIIGLAHATYLYHPICAMKFARASPGSGSFMKFSPIRKPR